MTEDMLHNRSTIALFEKLGLSRNEVKCYLASLELGPAKVSEIAKMAQVHRVNAYGAIKRLIKFGLIEQSLATQGRQVYSASFECLQEFVHDYQKQAIKIRWKVEDVIAKLQMRSNERQDEREVIIFEGAQAIFMILERSLHKAPPGTEILRIGLFTDEDMVSLKDYHQFRHTPERMERNCFQRLLCLKNKYYADNPFLDSRRLRETRFLPSALTKDVKMSHVVIYGDEVGIYWHTPKPLGVVIKNQHIMDTMKMLFNIAWGVAEKPKIKTT